jgi:hypothetical protein
MRVLATEPSQEPPWPDDRKIARYLQSLAAQTSDIYRNTIFMADDEIRATRGAKCGFASIPSKADSLPFSPIFSERMFSFPRNSERGHFIGHRRAEAARVRARRSGKRGAEDLIPAVVAKGELDFLPGVRLGINEKLSEIGEQAGVAQRDAIASYQFEKLGDGAANFRHGVEVGRERGEVLADAVELKLLALFAGMEKA